jgi:histone H3/H4
MSSNVRSTIAIGSAGPSQMSPGSSQWLDEHLSLVRDRILEEAIALAEQDNRQTVEPRDIAEATKAFAPGVEVAQPLA